MKEVNVIVFGADGPAAASSCSCGCCGPGKPMREEAENLGKYLVEKFGNAVKFTYVDVKSEKMQNYPDIATILDKVRLPLTVLNGHPRFHGGLSTVMIENAVAELLKQS
ncbi:MAG: hypothetical protein QHH75_13155 [Bacillota bacterium]|nr:hypothetical protein [Bacillota bacterium]